ncbi:DUF3866 family protein [Bacillus shivajii]|nr:DUF3866 family protein [Bacillus shivajii]
MKTDGGCGRALIYKRLLGSVNVGEKITVNTTATNLKLGTGGWDITRSIEREKNHCVIKQNKEGHIMKARYLSDQHSIYSVEAPESNDHHFFQKKLDLQGKKVLIGELHSIVPVVWLLLRQYNYDHSLVTIISDEASLPLMMSDHLHFLHEQKSFLSITTGQAFGGQVEAVNIITALQYVMETNRKAATLITLGPGVVGTNSTYGFSGIAQADWANLVRSFHGVPVWVPRLSEVEERSRHHGISHHTLTPLTELTYGNQLLPLPYGEYSNQLLEKDMKMIENKPNITVIKRDESLLFPLLRKVQKDAPFPIKSMGRTLDQDPLFFLGIAAAVDLLVNDRDDSSCTK